MQYSDTVPYMKANPQRLTREEARQQNRQRLIEAAADVFAERGFHAASVDAIADRVGLTKGAAYANFASKEDLFLVVLEARMQAQVEMVEHLAVAATGLPAEEVLGLTPSLDWLDERWCLLVFEFWLHALRHPPVRYRLAELYGRFRSGLAPLLERYVPAGLAREELAGAVIALYQGLALQRHCDPEAISADLIKNLLAALDNQNLRQEATPGAEEE